MCDEGYFDDGHSATCMKCSDSVSNCQTCAFPLNSSYSASDYATIFDSGTWPSDIAEDFVCQSCDSPYFLNVSSDQCEVCTLNYCLTCADLSQCLVCDANASALIFIDNLCYLCTVDDCTVCNANDFCEDCD